MTLKSLWRALAVITVAVSTISIPNGAASASEEAVTLECFPHERSSELLYDNTWGASRSGGRGHKGTDIMSPKGLEVRAVADGVVKTLKNGPTSGYYVRLVHEGGWETWYMHLNNDEPGTDDGTGGADTAYAPGLTEGTTVRAGDLIGYVGDSGNAEWTGSHTHFELHIDGKAVNPYPYLVEAQEREDLLIGALTALAFTAANEAEQIHQDQRGNQLLAHTGGNCLPDSHKDILEQLFGHRPGATEMVPSIEAR